MNALGLKAFCSLRQVLDCGSPLPLSHQLRIAFLILSATVAAAIRLSAQPDPDPSAAFDAANRLYEEGRYREAVEAYQDIDTKAPFAALHFNLGNAFYQAGKPGQAIAEFRHAHALAPRDRDVTSNLKFVRNSVSGPTWKSHWTERLVQRLAPAEWHWATSASLWLCFGLLALGQVRPGWRPGLRRPVIATALLAATLLGLTFWNDYDLGSRRFAVVVEPEVVVRLGPFDASPAAMTVKDGAELLVVDQKGDWFQVTADGRASGWIRADTVRPLW